MVLTSSRSHIYSVYLKNLHRRMTIVWFVVTGLSPRFLSVKSMWPQPIGADLCLNRETVSKKAKKKTPELLYTISRTSKTRPKKVSTWFGIVARITQRRAMLLRVWEKTRCQGPTQNTQGQSDGIWIQDGAEHYCFVAPADWGLFASRRNLSDLVVPVNWLKCLMCWIYINFNHCQSGPLGNFRLRWWSEATETLLKWH